MSAFISCISGVGLRVADHPACVDFYSRVWGLEVIERTAEVARFRGTGALAPVLSLAAAPVSRFDYIVMIAKTPEAVPLLAAHLEQKGYELTSPVGTDFPEGKQGLSCRDPDGNEIRVIGQPAVLMARPSTMHPIGLSHLALNSVDGAAARRFYVEGLGFRLTDSSKNTGLDFLGCNELHHCIALLGGCKVSRVNHVAYEIRDLETWLRKVGQLVQDGARLIGGPGRHDVGYNTFAYFADPNEWAMEVSCDMEVLPDPDNWRARHWINSRDLWGFGLSLRNEEMRSRTLD